MGNSQITGSGLEEARTSVPTEKIVVHGAQIVCNWAGDSKTPNYLSIKDNHGIMEDGKNCAHDGSCIPFENINPFTSCRCPSAKKALTVLSKSARGEDQKRYASALQTILDNEVEYGSRPVPCTLPLLDRWFGADEKETISNAMGMEIKVRKKIDGLRNKLYDAIERGQKVISSAFYFELYIRENFGDEYFSGEENSYSEKRKLIKKIRKDVKRLCPALMNEIDTITNGFGENFASVIIQLNKARDQLDQLIGCWDQAYEIVGRLDDYREIRQELETLRSEVDGLIQEFNSWKPEEYHLITTESFLVCRCGGIITIADSGQNFWELATVVEGSVYEMISQFIQHCSDGMGKYALKEEDPVNHQWSSFEKAFRGLKEFQEVYRSEDKAYETEDVNIYVEYICKSYNDEIGGRIMGAAGLMSIKCTALGVLLSFYTIETGEESDLSSGDAMSALITTMEAAGDEGDGLGGIFSKVFSPKIIDWNNAYTAFSSMKSLIYVSHDSYVENIQITVFTDTHAHVARGTLNAKGELQSGINFYLYERNDYIEGNLGRGLEWQEEKGIYVRSLVHQGDNRNVGKEAKNGTDFKGSIPFSVQ